MLPPHGVWLIAARVNTALIDQEYRLVPSDLLRLHVNVYDTDVYIDQSTSNFLFAKLPPPL